ncbi:hypothetical protein, partial [Streptomyces sp. GbtcB7]|uniref:hypothetical protein n=1 Tax=Streptomyces sp. GbtcB7 TaxID=2824752 RepID=UPI001C30E6B7
MQADASAESLEDLLARPDLDDYISNAIHDEQEFADIVAASSGDEVDTVRLTVRRPDGRLFHSASTALGVIGGLLAWATNA